jgi:hypothetical protein
MAKKMSSFQELGREYGIQEYKVYYLEILSSTGRKGAKLIRVETLDGREIPVKEFISKNSLTPQSLGVEFIGTKGFVVSNKIKLAKIRTKPQNQEQQVNQ